MSRPSEQGGVVGACKEPTVKLMDGMYGGKLKNVMEKMWFRVCV
jgi:hypothetical protein